MFPYYVVRTSMKTAQLDHNPIAGFQSLEYAGDFKNQYIIDNPREPYYIDVMYAVEFGRRLLSGS